MPYTDDIQLAPSPRRMPLGVRSALLFGGVAWQIVWAFLGVSLIGISQAVLPSAEGLFSRFSEPAQITVSGVVATVEEILPPPEVRHDPRYANHPKLWNYTFTYRSTKGKECLGRDFTMGYRPCLGETVTVTYESQNPSASHGRFSAHPEATPPVHEINGNPEMEREIARQNSWPRQLLGLWPLGFLCAIGLLVVFGMKMGAQRIRLLRTGRLAWGQLIAEFFFDGQRSCNNDIKPYYLMTFLFLADDDRIYNLTERSDSAEEWKDDMGSKVCVLYDAADPGKAIALRKKPGSDPFTIDAGGQIRANRGAGMLVAIVPTLVTAGFIYFLVQLGKACVR